MLAGTAFGQVFGTWKMNTALSKRQGAGPWASSYTVRYEQHPEGERVTTWRVTADGRSETEMYVLRFDGMEHPHVRPERFDSVSAHRLDGSTVEVQFKKNGKTMVRSLRRLSADSRQLTLDIRWVGEDRKAILILERQ